MIEAENLCKGFGDRILMENVNFRLPPGGIVGIIGPNGAGKTTMLNLIAGDLTPDEGRVVFEGVDITSLSSARRCRSGIGRTSQIPRPFEGMTVFENVLVGATFGGREPKRDSDCSGPGRRCTCCF